MKLKKESVPQWAVSVCWLRFPRLYASDRICGLATPVFEKKMFRKKENIMNGLVIQISPR